LGIGRGDSALAYIGLAPAPPAQFERYLTRLQGYLRAEEVSFDLETDAANGLKAVGTLHMDSAPTTSRLRWLRGQAPKVPVDVAASGPRVIDIAARLADAITFAVGVHPDRVGWAIGRARAARVAAGLDPDSLQLGSYVPLAVDDDRARARELLRGSVGSYARFSVMHGTVAGPVTETQRHTLTAVHQAYDMHAHFKQGSRQSQQLDEEALDAFAIAGPASYCVERVSELYDMGLRRFYLTGPGRGADMEAARTSHQRIVDQVLPALLS
jgi:5,10-methylenetetrahydromethanopterin reductase